MSTVVPLRDDARHGDEPDVPTIVAPGSGRADTPWRRPLRASSARLGSAPRAAAVFSFLTAAAFAGLAFGQSFVVVAAGTVLLSALLLSALPALVPRLSRGGRSDALDSPGVP